MTDEQKAMYPGICMCLTNEERLLWARSQILILINLGGFSFLGTQMTNSLLYLLASLAGTTLCLFWFVVNWKSQEMIDYYRDCLASIESPQMNLLVFRVFTGTKWDYAKKGITFYFLLQMLTVLFFGMWLIVFIMSFHVIDREEQIIRIIKMVIPKQ